MRYVAAYLLAALGGNTAPTSESIVKILSSVGIEAESDKLDKVIAELSGKDLKALIAEGKTDNSLLFKLSTLNDDLNITIFRLTAWWKLQHLTFFLKLNRLYLLHRFAKYSLSVAGHTKLASMPAGGSAAPAAAGPAAASAAAPAEAKKEEKKEESEEEDDDMGFGLFD